MVNQSSFTVRIYVAGNYANGLLNSKTMFSKLFIRLVSVKVSVAGLKKNPKMFYLFCPPKSCISPLVHKNSVK